MESNVSQLAQSLSLSDEISIPTEAKGQTAAQRETTIPDLPPRNENHFRENLTVVKEPEPVEEEEDEKATPEESAAATIDMIDLAQKTVFAIFLTRKQKKKYPEKIMNQFIEVDLKDLMGQELTEAEQRQLKRYREFESRLKMMIGEISFTDDEREGLMEATTALCKKHGIAIPSGVWFGVRVLELISKRIITLMSV